MTRNVTLAPSCRTTTSSPPKGGRASQHVPPPRRDHPKASMSADWGDSRKCGWTITEHRAPRRVHRRRGLCTETAGTPHLGLLFAPNDMEEMLVEERVNSEWKASWANRIALQHDGISHRLRARLLDTAIKPSYSGAHHASIQQELCGKGSQHAKQHDAKNHENVREAGHPMGPASRCVPQKHRMDRGCRQQGPMGQDALPVPLEVVWPHGQNAKRRLMQRRNQIRLVVAGSDDEGIGRTRRL